MTEPQHHPLTISTPAPAVLCVDMDGTLIRTDSLLESALQFLKRDGVRALFLLCFWVLGGKARLKRKLADRISLNPADLPYNRDLLDFLKAERAAGTRLVLATGADERIARRVADYLGIFDEVLASDGHTNLTASRKMHALIGRFGERGYRYAGNSRADLPVWRQAGQAIVCCASNALPRRLERERVPTERVFLEKHSTFVLIVKALRVYQWPKNLLIWVPLLLSHRMGEVGLIVKGAVAMVAFSFCASALYLVNDLLDLTADRAHPRKCARPFASGRLNPWIGVVMAPLLVVVSLLMAWALAPEFLLILALYAAGSVSYSFFFKEVPLLDVCLLGGLYVVRIFAGGAAMGIVISSWTLGYCMFLFLSLALLKRYVELLMLDASKQTAARGRGYVVGDYPILACFGAGTACVAALLLALYIESNEVQLLYRHPQRLWLLCGLHLYWISRAWLLANRGEMHHDPVLFALRDRTSYWLGLAGAAVALLAT